MTNSLTALDLPAADPLPEATRANLDLCAEKLGLVPDVLHASGTAELGASLLALSNRLMSATGMRRNPDCHARRR